MSLEALLQFFFVTCKSVVAGMPDAERATWEVLLCTDAAEEFIGCRNAQKIEYSLLCATKKYYDQLAKSAANMQPPIVMPVPQGISKWIDYTKIVDPAVTGEPEAAAPERVLPKVITYDESGVPEMKQDSKVQEDAAEVDIPLPWREWHASAAAQDIDKQASEMAAITMALRALHTAPQLRGAPVDVVLSGSNQKPVAVAAAEIKTAVLDLPACALKSAKISASSTHPHRMPIVVKHVAHTVPRRLAGKAEAEKVERLFESETTYYVHPEFKGPESVKPAVTGEAAASSGAREWKWAGDETMHPCWAVQRMTNDELQKKTVTEPHARYPAKFNVTQVTAEFNTVTLGQLNGKNVTCNMAVSVPVLTNPGTIKKGGLLVMELTAPAKTTKRKATNWKDDVVSAKAKARTAPKAKAKSKDSLSANVV